MYDKDYQNKYKRLHREELIQYAKEYYSKHKYDMSKYYASTYRQTIINRRLKLMEFLGNKCSNPDCLVPGGCEDIRCLQFDHIDGGGTRESSTMGYVNMVRYYLKHPEDAKKRIQLLCSNCNWIKRHENKEVGGRIRFNIL